MCLIIRASDSIILFDIVRVINHLYVCMCVSHLIIGISILAVDLRVSSLPHVKNTERMSE